MNNKSRQLNSPPIEHAPAAAVQTLRFQSASRFPFGWGIARKERSVVVLFVVVFTLMLLGRVAIAASDTRGENYTDSQIDARIASLDQGKTQYAVGIEPKQNPDSSQNRDAADERSPFTLLSTLFKEWEISWGTIPSPTLFLPYITHNFAVTQPVQYTLADRIGFGLTSAALAPYTDVTTLGAGWYLDWRVRETPERPADMDFVQMVRVHQELSCGEWYHGDRAACPYAEPLNYRYRPSQSAIETAAIANPGSIWLIGNEMDRKDWSYCIQWNGAHCDVVGYNGQDEILPETYAIAYHDLYQIIKTADPTAQVSIGGIIQPTPLRLEYISAIWDAYQTTYSETMPVDVWNVHNFIIREKANDWGADVPPGSQAALGSYVISDAEPQSYHVDMEIFEAQIIAFRQWMKERGQQQKPLIVSEYGVLFPNSLMNPTWAGNNPIYVQEFMIASFDFFATAADCSLGYGADGCKLVQQWNWYSLDDTWGSFNPHSRLFDPTTKEMTSTGQRFQEYLAQE